MKVSEAMSRDVQIASPDQTIQAAAQLMADIDAGVLPVGENDQLVGMLTDRDIAVRAVARGRDPHTKVRDIMTAEVKYCFEDDDADKVCSNMAEQQIRRLPVVNREKRLTGILSLADLATSDGGNGSGKALSGISQPGGRHTQHH